MARACLWIIVLSLALASCSSGVHARRPHLQTREDGQDGDGAWTESVARARCASRCLGLHSVQTSSTQNNGSLSWCKSHKQCSRCLEPCKASWEMKKKNSCSQMCQHTFPMMPWECVGSCDFLNSVVQVKQGSCPSPDRAQGFEAVCAETCDLDSDCPGTKRCCSNGCGHTCQSPLDPYKGVPLKPRKELVFGELSSGELEVHWSSRFNVSAEPVVYVLQRRWNYGIQPSEDSATSWEEVAQATEPSVRVSDFRPGRWYQFRVAAVNSHGSRGFTTPSRHTHSTRDPSPPPAPSDLRVTSLSFGPGRSVSALLQWDPPLDLNQDQDVPVQVYRVSWTWALEGSRTGVAQRKRRKTVTEPSMVLSSLRSNRSYSVEVQAVSYWKQNQLKSPKSIITFSTQHNPSLPPKSSEHLLDVGTPFYQDGQLRVHVYWQKSPDPLVEFYKIQWGPEYCGHNQTKQMEKIVTEETFVSLSGLLFSCRYKVVLRNVGKKSKSKSESTSFLTPSCATVQAKSRKPVKCNGQTAVASQKVNLKASNLTAAFDIRGGNVTAIFSWDLPTMPTGLVLGGSQVTWSEVMSTDRYGNNNKLQHSLVSQSQILPPGSRVWVVSGLRLFSLYKLEVQLVTLNGVGPVSRRTFQTPARYETATNRRPRLKKHHQQQPINEQH